MASKFYKERLNRLCSSSDGVHLGPEKDTSRQDSLSFKIDRLIYQYILHTALKLTPLTASQKSLFLASMLFFFKSAKVVTLCCDILFLDPSIWCYHFYGIIHWYNILPFFLLNVTHCIACEYSRVYTSYTCRIIQTWIRWKTYTTIFFLRRLVLGGGGGVASGANLCGCI